MFEEEVQNNQNQDQQPGTGNIAGEETEEEDEQISVSKKELESIYSTLAKLLGKEEENADASTGEENQALDNPTNSAIDNQGDQTTVG